MPTVSPTGSLSLGLSYLRSMIARTSAFQTRTGTGNETAAAAFIYYGRYDADDADDSLDDEVCTVRHLDEQDFELIATLGFSSQMSLIATFYFPIPVAYRSDFEDAYLDFTNALGGIVDELKGMQAVAGNLLVTNYRVLSIGQVDPDELNGQHVFAGEVLVSTR